MKSRDKDNLEDFFNQSLESFNEAPSGKVWEGIASQINRSANEAAQAPKTPQNKINNKLMLPFFILGTLFFISSAFILNQQSQTVEALNQQLVQIQKEALAKGENYEALEEHFIKNCATTVAFTNESFFSVSPKISEL